MRMPTVCRIALAGASMLSFSACAHMTVQVDILDSSYWSSANYVDAVTLARIADTAQAIRDGRFFAQRDDLKRSVAQTLTDLAKPPATISPVDIPQISSALGNTIDATFEMARAKFEEAFAAASQALQTDDRGDRAKRLAQASQHFGEGARILRELAGTLSSGLRTRVGLPALGPVPDNLKPQDAVVKTLEQKAEKVAEGLIGGAGILDDPRASAVVYAPDRYWTGRFNETVCTGTFGNTDCAVKMEGLGSFTIKGVRLDAAKITQATFSVARQAVQTVAAVYGIPLPKVSAPGGAAPTDAVPPPELDSPGKRQRDATAALVQLRLVRLGILETIVGERQAIANPDTAVRGQAISTIKAVFEASRKQLDPPAGP